MSEKIPRENNEKVEPDDYSPESFYSGFYGIVGGNEQSQREAALFLGEAFVCQGGKTFVENGKEYEVKDFEREKTQEEINAITAIVDKLFGFVQRYGADGIDLDPAHFHFLDRNKFVASGLEPRSFYAGSDQFVGICDFGNFLANAQGVVHEGLHFSSFQTAQIKGQGFLDERRSGFNIKTKKGEIYFKDIDEAVISELTKKFDKEFFGNIPELAGYFRERKEFIDHFLQCDDPQKAKLAEDIAYIQRISSAPGIAGLGGFSYSNVEPRQRLNLLIYKIQAESKGKFGSKEEIFDIFSRAVMHGNLLPVAKLVEETFGKGSFRKLGEATKLK